MKVDRNLLFGVLACRLDLLTASQLAQACAECAKSDERILPDLCDDEGWLSQEDGARVHAQLDELLEDNDGDHQRVLLAIERLARDSGPQEDDDQEHFEGTIALPAEEERARRESQTGGGLSDLDSENISPTIDSAHPVNLDSAPPNTGVGGESHPFADTLDAGPAGRMPNTSERLDTVDVKPEQRSRYTLTRVYGEGGLGQVWLAFDPNLNRRVALKNILPTKNSDPVAVKRLIREAQITGQLEHPNIVPVYELDHTDESGQPFYTMRFLRGRTLGYRIKKYHRRLRKGRAKPMEFVELLSAFVGICNAMAYAGSRGVIHRDLKPDNVMLGDFGEVVVLDWGLAKTIGSKESREEQRESVKMPDEGGDNTKTLQGQVVGSPAYMAPEQAKGQHDVIDQTTDVYGLGAILYVILTGRAPHRGKKTGNTARDTIELLRAISEGETPRAKTIKPQTPAALDAICAKAMHVDQNKRYQDPAELADDIQRWQADEPVSAYREPWRQRVGRWLRRHKSMAQAIAGSLVAITVISVIAAVVVRGAWQAEKDAHDKTEKAYGEKSLALEEARKARLAATRSFRQARRAVDESFTGISDGLLNYPGVQRLRTELLLNAASHYERFAAERSDDPALRIEFGLALLRLGDVRRLLVQFDKSQAAYESALKEFASLRKDDPENDELKLVIAQGNNALGLLHATVGAMPDNQQSESSYQKAEQSYAAAEKELKPLLLAKPDDLELSRVAAKILANRGVLATRNAKYGDAKKLFADAAEAFAKLAELSKLDSDREEQAKLQISHGELLINIGENELAKSKLQDAIESYEQLVKNDEEEPRYLQGVADARLTLANVYNAMGRSSEPVPLYQAAIDDYVLLVKNRPDVPHYRERLATAEVDIAQVLSRLGRSEEAKEHAEIGLGLAMDLVNENSEVAEYHVKEIYATLTLGQVLRDRNDFTLAEIAFRKGVEKSDSLITVFPNTPLYHRLHGESQNNLGLVYLLAETGEPARQAFMLAQESFKKAVQFSAEDVFSRDGLAWSQTYLGDALRMLDRKQEAKNFYRMAFASRAELDQNNSHRYQRAWLMVHCQDAELHLPADAEEIAKALIEDNDTMSDYLLVLAAAAYRQGRWQDALEAIENAESVRISRKSPLEFWRAMALWKLERKADAQTAWKLAVDRMQKNAPGDLKLRRLKKEASAYFGQAEPAKETPTAPPSDVKSKPAPADAGKPPVNAQPAGEKPAGEKPADEKPAEEKPAIEKGEDD